MCCMPFYLHHLFTTAPSAIKSAVPLKQKWLHPPPARARFSTPFSTIINSPERTRSSQGTRERKWRVTSDAAFLGEVCNGRDFSKWSPAREFLPDPHSGKGQASGPTTVATRTQTRRSCDSGNGLHEGVRASPSPWRPASARRLRCGTAITLRAGRTKRMDLAIRSLGKDCVQPLSSRGKGGFFAWSSSPI